MALPPSALATLGERPFGVYVHVPWCSSRCGYCDFNTYVPGHISDATPRQFVDDATAEIVYARRAISDSLTRPVDTVFFGGGTPTLLPAEQLGFVLQEIRESFGFAEDAEITTEANPETLSPEYLEALRKAGFNRLSLGMQSAVPEVLATLDRVHTPGRALEAVQWAREAGFEEISVDLIYGAPGETLGQWQQTVEAALSVNTSHISAYSLIVEPGTRMARQVASGELVAQSEDDLAEFYTLADSRFVAAGLDWYEVSNWAKPGSEAKHNLGYWRGDNWWGVGPGAHSHIGGVRWWNVKHPGTYANRLRRGEAPLADLEELTPENQLVELLMLGIRTREGVRVADLTELGFDITSREIQALESEGLVTISEIPEGRIWVPESHRLLADWVVRRMING
ncbi:MAG: radical SAM family heme chaperone HemW [Candidatus Nanopelagicales bacterium]